MPRGFLEDYYSDEEFHQMLGWLNALSPEWSGWRHVTARKEHEDLFGEAIGRSEVYFQRQIGVAWGDSLKLSRLSMERLLYAVFAGNQLLADLAREVGDIRQEALRETVQRCSPLSTILGRKDRESEEGDPGQ